jgi:hypothetical protein
LGSSGDGLGMITGGVCENSSLSDIVFKCRYGVERSSELERARVLQMFGFEMDFGSQSFVQKTGTKNWCSSHHASKSSGCCVKVDFGWH